MKGAAFKAVLSGFMALLLWIAATLSVSEALHQFLHHNAKVGGHICLVCSLVKGQAGGPEAPFALAFGVCALLVCFRTVQDSFLPCNLDYCVSHGRAPPLR
jgi:hypothetical protein